MTSISARTLLTGYKKWLGRSKNRHLPAALNWLSYQFVLWSGLRYGIATLANPLSKLKGTLRKLDYETLPLLGVNRMVRVQRRTTPWEFGGIGMLSLEVEHTLGWINMILQHFGTQATDWIKCIALLEALQLEIGSLGNPLREKYSELGHIATSSWWTSIWERLQHYDFHLYLDYPTLKYPRENDCTLIGLLVKERVPKQDLWCLNRCHLHLRAIFLLDISMANGTHLEHWAWENTSEEARASAITFPMQGTDRLGLVMLE